MVSGLTCGKFWFPTLQTKFSYCIIKCKRFSLETQKWEVLTDFWHSDVASLVTEAACTVCGKRLCNGMVSCSSVPSINICTAAVTCSWGVGSRYPSISAAYQLLMDICRQNLAAGSVMMRAEVLSETVGAAVFLKWYWHDGRRLSDAN